MLYRFFINFHFTITTPFLGTLLLCCIEIFVNFYQQSIMHESIVIPACFSSGEKQTDDPSAVTRSGQSVFMSVYRTKIAGQCRLITVTWCKNMLLHGLSVSVEGPEGYSHYRCKVELKPWYFWRKHGSKQFVVDGKNVEVVWDLKSAKFNNGETEPRSDYYVAIVCDDEVVLLVGDLKKNAYQKTGCRPALIEPILVSRKEHVFGKRKFSTRVKFHEKDSFHDISIECINGSISSSSSSSNNGSSCLSEIHPQMEVRIDGQLGFHVKHLQWKFRGNESIYVNKTRVEVYWDVHDWLFSSGPRNALFIFKPNSLSSTSSSSSSLAPSSAFSTPTTTSSLGSLLMTTQAENSSTSSGSEEFNNDNSGTGSSRFCLFLYAWKVE